MANGAGADWSKCVCNERASHPCWFPNNSSSPLKQSEMLCPCSCPSVMKLASPRRMFRRSEPLMPVSIYLVTWNVLSRPPEENLKPLLGLDNVTNPTTLPDIYAIGLQEVKAMPYSILMDTIFETPWVKAIRLTLAPFQYVKIRVIRLQGLVLAIFVKRQHLAYVQEVETEYTRTGLGRVWGNKGAVSIRLNAFNCSICFVNSHLAAHDTELKRRIEDYNAIVDAQMFKYPETESIFFHDYIFWMGDLNFRLVEGNTVEQICQLISRKNYSQLLSDDQLHHVRETGQAFSELVEPPIIFAPTYKFIPGSQEYDKNRRPAYTDRILYKVNANVYENVVLETTVLHYRAHEEYRQSDHKPVTAFFQVKVFQSLPDHYVQFAPITSWRIGHENQVVYYLRAGQQSTVWDWIGLYKADFTNIDDYLAYTWVSGRGVAMPPTVSAQASENVIDSWQPTSIPSNLHVSESNEDVGSWGAEGTFIDGSSPPPGVLWSSDVYHLPMSGQGSGAEIMTSPYASRMSPDESSLMTVLADGTLVRRRDYSGLPADHSRSRRNRSNSREPRRSTARSHSPMRRFSEHMTSAVVKLASLFQNMPKTKYMVMFPEVLSLVPGQYILLYLSHGVDNIHGISEPFEITNPTTTT